MELVIPANAGAEGKLFGSVGPIDLVEAFSKVQVEVERSEIRMPDGPIHELGEFDVSVHLHSDVNADIKVRVVADEQSSAQPVEPSDEQDPEQPPEEPPETVM